MSNNIIYGWSTGTKIVASDRDNGVGEGEHFGNSVAMSRDGTKVIVGARYEDHYVDVDDEPKLLNNAGAAYIYAYNDLSSSWDAGTKIVAHDGAAYDYFGESVAMSEDGMKVIVGVAPGFYDSQKGTGCAYIYTYNVDDSSWDAGAKIKAPDPKEYDHFGRSVAMNSDGTKVIVGAPYKDHYVDDEIALLNTGAAYIYTYNDNDDVSPWGAGTKIVAYDIEQHERDNFGFNVAMSGDGMMVIVTSEPKPGGSAYIYAYNDDDLSWNAVKKIVEYDSVPALNCVAMNSDGTKFIVGARNEDHHVDSGTTLVMAGSVYIYTYNDDYLSWDTGTKIVAPDPAAYDRFGYSVAMSRDGMKVIVGARYKDHDVDGGTSLIMAGSAYIYTYNDYNSSWDTGTKIVAYDSAAYDFFGKSVAMNSDGTKVIVGAFEEDHDVAGKTEIGSAGSAYIYELTEPTTIYTYSPTEPSFNEIFGASETISQLYSPVTQTNPNDLDSFNCGRLRNIPAMRITAGSIIERDPLAALGSIRYNTQKNYVEVIHNKRDGAGGIWVELIRDNAGFEVIAKCFTTKSDVKKLKISETTIDDISGSDHGLRFTHFGEDRLIIKDEVSLSSDDRLKHNEEVIPNSLDLIEQLKPYKYQKTDKMYDASYNGIIHDKWVWEIGLIAQDVSAIPYLNFMVNQMPNDGMYTLSYLNLIGLLVQGTKDLYNENKSLKKDIESCKKDTHDVSGSAVVTIQELNNKIEGLKSRVLALKK